MPRCFIALGGNLGPVSETFQHALEHLDDDPSIKVQRTSRFFRSAAAGPKPVEGAKGKTSLWNP